MQSKYGLASLCDQVCVWRTVREQTDTQTDRKVKTEGPKIMSSDIH